jgi:hypothetical protein
MHVITSHHGAYTRLITGLDQESKHKIAVCKKLLKGLRISPDCSDLAKKIIENWKIHEDPQKFFDTAWNIIMDLESLESDLYLLNDILSDNHDLVLVIAGGCHITDIKRYLSKIIEFGTSFHMGTPNIKGFFEEPLIPEEITDSLNQAMAQQTSPATNIGASAAGAASGAGPAHAVAAGSSAADTTSEAGPSDAASASSSKSIVAGPSSASDNGSASEK